MKKVYIILSFTILTLAFVKCKPAAEDRFKMHENAKRISDSIARVIDQAMAEVAIPGSGNNTSTQEAKLPEAVKGSILSFSGNGKKSSEVFTLSSKSTKLKYKYKSSSNPGIFYIYVVEKGFDLQKSGGFPEVTTQKSEESESVIHKEAGSYYLVVDGAGSWTVDVIEE